MDCERFVRLLSWWSKIIVDIAVECTLVQGPI